MKLWKWVKNHPAEAMALAMGTALTGGAAAGVIGGGAAAAGAAEAGVAGASLAAGEEAAAIAAANAAAAGGAEAAALGGGEAVSGLAGSHAAGAGADSALLAAYPGAGEALAAEEFAAQMAATNAGQSALLSPFPAPSSVAGAGAESSLYGPNVATDPSKALDARAWYERFGDKLKDPKTVMRLGMMGAQMGAPRPQGGPQGFAYEQPGYRSAMHSQEDITKKWLMMNDPNTYRRIYGNPPQGAA